MPEIKLHQNPWHYCPQGLKKKKYGAKEYLAVCNELDKSVVYNAGGVVKVFPGPKPDISPHFAANYLPAVHTMVTHPVLKRTYPLFVVIISLNDQHRWTREQIADWLETLDIDLTFRS